MTFNKTRPENGKKCGKKEIICVCAPVRTHTVLIIKRQKAI